MKRLFLMRHAKSDWSEKNIIDFERGLNKRGFNDALLMGKILKHKNVNYDYILSSAAIRAQLTAQIVGAVCQYDIDKIEYSKKLYLCEVNELLSTIKNLPNDVNSVLLTNHNPTCEEFMYYLGFSIEKFPTSAVAILKFQTQTWKEAFQNNFFLEEFLYPKLFK